MIPDSIRWFRCPNCQHNPLTTETTTEQNGRIMTGQVVCPRCQQHWPIVNGVPRFVASENYARSFGGEWNLFSKTQLDSHTKTTISRDRFSEVTQTQPSDLAGKLVLECGCGMGRFLEPLAQAGANVIGIDFSTAVDAAFANLHQYPNVTIVQADLFNLPFQQGIFDFVYSIGVLHHTPNTQRALQAIARHTKPDGSLAIWVYHKHSVLKPHYLYHYLFRHLTAARALALIKLYHPIPWFLRRIPVIGKPLATPLPISDYRGKLPLNSAQQLEWSYLDTVDKMTPWYIWRHAPEQVRQWFDELGYADITVGQTPCSVKGRRSLSTSDIS